MPKSKKQKAPKKYTGNPNIEKIGSPILRKDIMNSFPSLEDDAKRKEFVASEAWLSYCNKAFFTFRIMNRSGEAAAIAANQLNFPFPAFIWKPENKLEIVLCPKIEYIGQEWVEGTEGCLSIPGEVFSVYRMDTVELRGYDHWGSGLGPIFYSGFNSRVLQHEVDHLYGGLVVDYSDDKDGVLSRLRKERRF